MGGKEGVYLDNMSSNFWELYALGIWLRSDVVTDGQSCVQCLLFSVTSDPESGVTWKVWQTALVV